MRFLFAAQLGRPAVAGRIAARQFLIIRCLWNDFLFQNKMAEDVSSEITTTLKKLQSCELSPAHSLSVAAAQDKSAPLSFGIFLG